MPPIYLTYLNSHDNEDLSLTFSEILTANECGLSAHGRGEAVMEPRMHLGLGQIVTGLKLGRESDDEANLPWRRRPSLSDIALGHAMLSKGEHLGISQRLKFA